jgi:transcription elongation factor GreA
VAVRLKSRRYSPIIPLPQSSSTDNLRFGRARAGQVDKLLKKGIDMASADKVPMLPEGHAMLTDELKRLRLERPEIVEAIEVARAHGDLSENAEYHAAKERQGQIEMMIADLEDKLSRAMVIDPTTLSGDKVVFGATVTMLDEDEKTVRYQLVGQAEADAKVGRISYNSPLGRALIGRQAGEEVEVSTPSGDRYYEIEKIEFV